MKAVSLISGGIDSPVAAYLMAHQGIDVIALHMDNRPYASQGSVKKVARLVQLVEQASGQRIEFHYAPHGRNQEINSLQCRRPYQCVLCKRLMLRVAKGVAIKFGAEAVITGESLGQVASQTLHNLRSEETGLDFPVLRPLIGIDKLEIEAMAKRIGTYETSISGLSGPACTILPEHVITMAEVDNVLDEESKVDIAEMIEYAVSNLKGLTDLDRESS